MNIANSVHEWIKKITVEMLGEIPNMNYLGEEEGAVTVEGVPSRPVVKRYVDGGELRQYSFVIALREEYGEDIEKNIGTTDFFDELANEIETRSQKGDLPMPDDAEPREVVCESSGYAISNTQRTVRYQMQLKFIYYKRGR